MQNCKENITSSAVHNVIKRVQEVTRLRINAQDFWAARGAALKTGMTVSWKYLYGVWNNSRNQSVNKVCWGATNAG